MATFGVWPRSVYGHFSHTVVATFYVWPHFLYVHTLLMATFCASPRFAYGGPILRVARFAHSHVLRVATFCLWPTTLCILPRFALTGRHVLGMATLAYGGYSHIVRTTT